MALRAFDDLWIDPGYDRRTAMIGPINARSAIKADSDQSKTRIRDSLLTSGMRHRWNGRRHRITSADARCSMTYDRIDLAQRAMAPIDTIWKPGLRAATPAEAQFAIVTSRSLSPESLPRIVLIRPVMTAPAAAGQRPRSRATESPKRRRLGGYPVNAEGILMPRIRSCDFP